MPTPTKAIDIAKSGVYRLRLSFHQKIIMPIIYWYLDRCLLREAWHKDKVIKVYSREEYEAAKFGLFDKAMKRFRYE